MATGAVSSARDPQHDVRWKWLLLGLCALASVLIIFQFIDNFGMGGRPWFGWWESGFVTTDHPYVGEIFGTVPGGATAQAGLRDGDRVDLREQSLEARQRWLYLPMATSSVIVRAHRGTRVFSVRAVGRSLWEGAATFKIALNVVEMLPAVLFLGCATLIAARRWWISDARVLALAMLCEIGGESLTPGNVVVPGVELQLLLTALSSASFVAGAILLVSLTSRYGSRPRWRWPIEWCGYAINAAVFLVTIAAIVGIITLWIDPTPLAPDHVVLTGATVWWSLLNVIAPLAIAACAIAAVTTSPVAEQSRTAWILLPLPLVYSVVGILYVLFSVESSYWVSEAILFIIDCCWLLGALFVTYALLKRRVLDFGFVLNRAVVVSIVGLIVIIAFVLLEWVLGSLLTGVSHATGLIANAALALVIGVSLSYIHKRVDQSVDLVLFRKRHEDEKALLGFSKEAAYITEWDALLDATLEKVRRHTDARSAAVLIGLNGLYSPVRSFGDNTITSMNENDEAVLALKVWHKPIDPHHYDTALHAALALPMLSRGRLYGVLILGERKGGEAYAPDEVEALSQLANGVGSALEALSLTTGSANAMADYVAGLHQAIGSLNETMVSEFQKLRTSSLT